MSRVRNPCAYKKRVIHQAVIIHSISSLGYTLHILDTHRILWIHIAFPHSRIYHFAILSDIFLRFTIFRLYVSDGYFLDSQDVCLLHQTFGQKVVQLSRLREGTKHSFLFEVNSLIHNYISRNINVVKFLDIPYANDFEIIL